MRGIEFSPDSYRGEQKEVIAKAYAKAEALFLQHEIKPRDFIHLYTERAVLNDLDYVSRLEKKMDLQNSPHEKTKLVPATILEAIIFEQGEQSEWFGPEASTIKTSRYDDVVNKVDTIIEFIDKRKKASHSALAIDATFSLNIHDKLNEIKKMINAGTLANIKYFQSDNSPHRGELLNVPLTVVSSHYKTVQELSRLWVDNDHEALGKHWIQFQLLDELTEQGHLYADYATKVKQPKIANLYQEIAELAEEILRVKTENGLVDPGIRDDNFYKNLQDMEKIFHY